MRLNQLFLVLIAAILFCRKGYAQSSPVQWYEGKLVAIDTSYEGNIYFNLFGENPDSIKIEWHKISADGLSETIRWVYYDIGSVNYIILHQDTFYFKNLEEDYKETRMNVPVKKIYGSNLLGLYEFTLNDGSKNNYIGVVQHNPYFIKHPIFTNDIHKIAITFAFFESCSPLFQKMKSEQDGYWFKKTLNEDERLTVWKKIIDEYQSCSRSKTASNK